VLVQFRGDWLSLRRLAHLATLTGLVVSELSLQDDFAGGYSRWSAFLGSSSIEHQDGPKIEQTEPMTHGVGLRTSTPDVVMIAAGRAKRGGVVESLLEERILHPVAAVLCERGGACSE
jgi:hypothetical protein